MSQLRIKIYDQLGFLLLITKVDEPLPRVFVWGERILERHSKRVYHEVTWRVLEATADSGQFKTL